MLTRARVLSACVTGLLILEANPNVALAQQGEMPTVAVGSEEASDTQTTAEKKSSGNRFIEEIVVTAQKREENLQDVPISVAAFSAEALSARGIDDAPSLVAATPGMVYSQVANYSIIYIRGIGTDAFVPSADLSIATYIDGIFFPFSHGLAQSFGAVERVELLKGPQGTLFGRNSTGGAISITTKKPGQDFENSLQASYGSYDDAQTRFYTNVPLTDTFALSISGVYNNADSYYKLTSNSPHPPLPQEVQKGSRVRLRWTPDDRWDITLSGLLMQTSGTGTLLSQQTNPYPQYALLGATPVEPYHSSVDASVYSKSRNPVLYGEVSYRGDWFDVKALGSNQKMRTQALYDYDGTNLPLVSFEAFQRADVDTAELQILSNNDSWMSDRLTWIFGLYHIKQTAGFDPVYFAVGRNIPQFSQFVANIANSGGLLGALPLDVLDGLQSGVNIELQGLLNIKSTAGFFQTTYKLLDSLDLTLGGRYQKEDRILISSRSSIPLTDAINVPFLDFSGPEAKTTNFSPKVSIAWHVNDDVMTYGSYQKGFKSGTYNIINLYLPSQYIKPEVVKATELGIKSQLFGGRLQLNGAVFNNDIDNLQVQFVSLLSGGAVKFETAKQARIRGIDFDLLWEVAPDALPGLVATAGGAYLDAKYVDYQNASGFNDLGVPYGGTGLVIGGGVTPGKDFSGNRIVRSPKYSGSAGLGYTYDMASGSLEVAGDIYYSSGYYYSAQNSANDEEPAYHVVNGRISYLYQPWDLRVTLFGKNLTDETYAINRLATDFGTNSYFAAPRTFGVRLNWDF